MKVCIIGGGVIGITTALRIKQRNLADQVTVVTDKTTPYTTGDGSAGLIKVHCAGDDPTEKKRL